MEDEFYDGPTIEEDLQDGELPSLSTRSRSNPRRGSPQNHRVITAFWNQDEGDIAAAVAKKEAEDAASAHLVRKRMARSDVSNANTTTPVMDTREFERVKVAGFWSQLDEDDQDSHFEPTKMVTTAQYEEDGPDDERSWRESAEDGADGHRSQFNTNHMNMDVFIENNESSESEGDDNDTPGDTMTSHTAQQQQNWNLIEQAACFAKNEQEGDTTTAPPASAHDHDQQSDHESTNNQSLDKRSYQSTSNSKTTEGGEDEFTTESRTRDSRTTINDSTNQHNPKDEEEMSSVLNCLSDILGTMCGYSTYIGDSNIHSSTTTPSSAEKKERAMAIIEKDRQRRDEGLLGYSQDESEHQQRHLDGVVQTFDTEYDEVEDMGNMADAAIELEYLSRNDEDTQSHENDDEEVDDTIPEEKQTIDARDHMTSNTVVAGVMAVGAAGLVAATTTSKNTAAPSSPTEAPLSPTTETKKKRLTVKAVKNLLGLRKKKEVVNETTPNLAAVMTSAKAEEEEMPKMEDVEDDDSIFTEDGDNGNDGEPGLNTTQDESTLGGLNSYNQEDSTTRAIRGNPNHQPYNKNRSIFDEEELESQAAGWDSHTKNSYLRDLAQRAKQDYQQKKSGEPSHPDPDLTTGGFSASMAAAALGAAAVGGAIVNAGENERPESPVDSISANESTTDSKGSYNVDYNSFNPLEKRKFLRLLNSGMTPQEATRIIVEEKEEDIPTLEDADDNNDHESDEGYIYETQEDEEDSYDPPGSVLNIESGESAEPSIKDEETEKEISRSEKATAGDSSYLAVGVAGTAAVAALAVPAIVRAKSKSKFTGQQEEGDDHQEETYQRGADGLVAVGDKYYDSIQTSYEQEDVDNTFLIDKEKGRKTKKISKKPNMSASFAKVASRRSIGSTRSSSNKFTSVNEKSVAQQHFARPNESRTVKDDTSVDDTTLSPGSEASSSRAPKMFTFRNRGSKWTKVGSNLDSDVIASQTMENEDYEFYAPNSAPVLTAKDTTSPGIISPISIPDDETPGAAQRAYEYGKSPASASSAIECPSVRPSVDASHVALPSLSPNDARERNVVTPTNDVEEREMFSPAHSAMEIASRSNSLFMSPDTLSPTSPQDFGSIAETPDEQVGSRGGSVRASSFLPVVEGNAPRKRSTSTSPANTMPLMPTSPNDSDNNSVTNYSLAEQSFITLGTTCTKSSRRRHKGAAGRRLAQAKDAETHAGPTGKGWMGSIRDVASMRDQAWDPKSGWQDYSEPEKASTFGETRHIGSLHLAEKIAQRKLGPAIESQRIPPGENTKERENSVGSQPRALPVEDCDRDINEVSFDEKSVFTNDSTVNTSAAPTRRSKPKQMVTADARKVSAASARVTADTRIVSAASAPKKIGWKESMEAAAAVISDDKRQWNYKEGWIESQDSDDVSELTKITMERSPESSPVETVSPFLPSVAEGIAESESHAEEDRQESTSYENDNQENVTLSLESYDAEEEFDVDQFIVRDAPVGDSDKENELSNVASDDNSEDASKLTTEEYPLAKSKHLERPPLPKRSLNQWLEKSTLQDSIGSSPDTESDKAVNSRELNIDPLDDVQVDNETTSEITVVKGKWNFLGNSLAKIPVLLTWIIFFNLAERCDDIDRELFQNDASDIPLDSSNSRELVMESFGSVNSSENEWLDTLEDDGNHVSSRALTWMSSKEKSGHNAPRQDGAMTTKFDPGKPEAASTQHLDPPGVVSERATTKRVLARYNPGTTSGVPPDNVSQQPRSRVKELASKLENPNKETSSIHSEEGNEHDVIFHSSSMGIRLKRGEDGLVRVVSVTESSPGSSVVRTGLIEPNDILHEAAGADLRSPITNSEWGEIVQVIRKAPRPMKFVVVSARRRQANSPTVQKPPRILLGADDTVASSIDDDSTAKKSILNRMTQCTIPEKSTRLSNGEGNDVPMAHLAFLRTNSTIARVREEASRRYPALCGRPDTIFEEPDSSGQHLSQPTSYDESAMGTSAGLTSVTSISGDNNVAYLDNLMSNTAVSNKTRARNTQKQIQGRISPTGSNEVGWPNNEQAYMKEFDAFSSYSSASGQSLSYRQKDGLRQDDLSVESKVVAMMEHELQHLDSAEECEI